MPMIPMVWVNGIASPLVARENGSESEDWVQHHHHSSSWVVQGNGGVHEWAVVDVDVHVQVNEVVQVTDGVHVDVAFAFGVSVLSMIHHRLHLP